MMTREEGWFWLGGIPGIGTAKTKRLLAVLGAPEAVFTASQSALTGCGVSEKDVGQIMSCQKDETWRKRFDAMKAGGIQFYYPEHERYPHRLKGLADAPNTLFVRGELPKEDVPSVAVIGSREPSAYGLAMTERLAKSLAGYGIATVSGLARGIDGACHRGSLAGNGATYAVLGNGVDIFYPREHRRLQEACAGAGGVVSEYPPGTEPEAWRFPLRNRIISALCDALVVMEAGEKSGTLITVDYALDQGRDVFALPGRVTDEKSKGCNRLIRSGAFLLTDTEDILTYFGMEKREKQDLAMLTEAEQAVYRSLDFAPEDIDIIARKAGLDERQTSVLLGVLTVKGIAGESLKRYYRKKIL